MEEILFTVEKGEHSIGNIKVYALSTCAFCKKALSYLREKSISFEYVYVDDLKRNIKKELKKHLQTKYNKDVGFPFLVFNDETILVGFRQNEYEEILLEKINV